ncbi:L-seryl-tRNA(Sec) kinase [Anopheles gambiae]|uniref:L-seryl-tRNA(Sec) kinase n=1 Tax=Anopheles coluzzii TaxID=1518534 RepID=UPI0020FF8FAA|nr:L-seryl-tRNA(Sec) kinase [Anopheles coluzzii]XP_061498273.1 L-seryl-tRNA(Sec) kinase [Anopheles gambiae]
MARICLNVLVGIPGSGKTTYCQQLVALPGRRFAVVHVCYDSYIKIDRHYDTFRDVTGLYKTSRQKLLTYIEMIIHALKENDHSQLDEALFRLRQEFKHELCISSSLMRSDVVFVIDDNNYYRSMRVEWQKIARKLSIGYFESYFDTSLSLALERNRERALPIGEDVINRMWARLEKPCGKLYHQEHDFITINGLSVDYEVIVTKIQYCFEHPQESPAVQMVAEPMEQSNVHKVDIILRKLVSKKITEAKDSMTATKQNLQSYVKVLQERKKYVLEQIRTRELDVAEEMMNNIVEDLF